MQATQNERYAASITQVIMSLFDEESENRRYDLNDIDATDFFTGMVKAGAIIFNNLTGEEKNYLEYTHLCNQLIVQDIIDNK